MRADGLGRRAEPSPARSRGLLPDALEELNATVEELRVAEEEMRTQNEELLLTRLRVEAERHRYQDLFESAPDGYLVTDPNGRILEANRAASELLGIAPRFLKGRGLGTSVAPDDLPTYTAALNTLAESSAPPPYAREWALRLRRRHASPFHAAVTVARVAALGEQPATLRWLVRDVSAHREDEATLRTAFERERRIAETLQRLLLPTTPADGFPGLSIETFSQAASDEAEVGGGFFDAFALGEGVIALAVGIGSGGGLAAATRSAEFRYALRVLLREARRPASALARLHEATCAGQRLNDTGGDRNVAVTLVVLDTRTGEAALSSAGGEAPVLVRAGGECETFGDGGGSQALGVRSRVPYAETAVTLGRGDTLLLTAGLTATGSVAETAAAHHADAPGVMAQAVLDGARAGAGGTLTGDVCLLAARRE